MADSAIASFTDGVTAAATDRIAAARSPFAIDDDRYLTPAYIKDYILGLANTWTATQTFANVSAELVTVAVSTATPAGGSTAARLLFGTTAGFGIYYGSGAPTVSAAQGSIYLRSDGSSIASRLYVNTNGTTGWTTFASAA